MISTGDSLANSDDATSLLGASLRTVLVLVGSSVLVEIGFVVGALTSTLVTTVSCAGARISVGWPVASGIFTSSANVGRATKVKVARAVAQESASTCFFYICQ